jgi:hypothetical protein
MRNAAMFSEFKNAVPAGMDDCPIRSSTKTDASGLQGRAFLCEMPPGETAAGPLAWWAGTYSSTLPVQRGSLLQVMRIFQMHVSAAKSLNVVGAGWLSNSGETKYLYTLKLIPKGHAVESRRDLAAWEVFRAAARWIFHRRTRLLVQRRCPASAG